MSRNAHILLEKIARRLLSLTLVTCLCAPVLAADASRNGSNATARSRVVIAHDPEATEAFKPQPEKIRQILDRVPEKRQTMLFSATLPPPIVALAKKMLVDPVRIDLQPKTSAAVLAFSRLRGRALPVDSHHHRVAARLGLIGPKVDVGPSHALLEAQLPPDWSAQQVYDNHEALMLHRF